MTLAQSTLTVMARGPRDYHSATVKALYELGKGTCYFPGCQRKTIVFMDGEAYNNAEIAHIRGANKKSARYDPHMTDAERAAFANLILLCSPHHDLVDDRRPDDYPPDVLHSWKEEREREARAVDDGGLDKITEGDFKRLLAAAVAEVRPQRDILLEVYHGILIGGDLPHAPFGAMGEFSLIDPLRRADPQNVAMVKIRNAGALRASVEHVMLCYRFEGDPPKEMRAAGMDEFPGRNPRLPAPLEIGDSTHWVVPFEAFTVAWLAEADGQRFTEFYFEVGLASGEVLKSEPVSSEHVQLGM
ncbi:hypothetical protein ACWZJV_25475 [Nocardioides sp. WG-D5]